MLKTLLCAVLAAVIAVTGINIYVTASTCAAILTPEVAATYGDVDLILVLGCQVKADGTPSDMLADRIQRGVELYDLKAAPKLLMSGDHANDDYNEVGAMQQYAIAEGVPSTDILLDHSGFSTYESVSRAKEIFGAKRIIIVTQRYHLYRALNIAEALGIEAFGVAADYNTYAGQFMRDVREVLARVKDFGQGILKS